MKRDKFLKLIGLSVFASPMLSKAANITAEKKLAQIKAFNEQNVTQAIAAEIMSLAAWNHLNEIRFANTFEITQHWKDYGTYKGRVGGYTCRSGKEPISLSWEGKVTSQEDGITIYSPTTSQELRVFNDGDWYCVCRIEEVQKKWSDNYVHITRNTKTGHETIDTRPRSGHGLNQCKMIELYLKLGFYEYK